MIQEPKCQLDGMPILPKLDRRLWHSRSSTLFGQSLKFLVHRSVDHFQFFRVVM